MPPARVTGLPASTPSIANCTVPSGSPAPGATATTVAVNWTATPAVEGFWEAARVVAVDAMVTAWPPASVPEPALKLALAL